MGEPRTVKWGIIGAGLIADERIAPGMTWAGNSELVAAGERGEVKLLRASILFRTPEAEQANPWRWDPAIEVGCHCADILEFVTGLRAAAVRATTDRPRQEPPVEMACQPHLTPTSTPGSTPLPPRRWKRGRAGVEGGGAFTTFRPP